MRQAAAARRQCSIRHPCAAGSSKGGENRVDLDAIVCADRAVQAETPSIDIDPSIQFCPGYYVRGLWQSNAFGLGPFKFARSWSLGRAGLRLPSTNYRCIKLIQVQQLLPLLRIIGGGRTMGGAWPPLAPP